MRLHITLQLFLSVRQSFVRSSETIGVSKTPIIRYDNCPNFKKVLNYWGIRKN